MNLHLSSLGATAMTCRREAWCERTKQLFAGRAATHHTITNPRIAIDGDRSTIRPTSAPSTRLAPRSRPAARIAGLVVSFYDDIAVGTPEGRRLSSVKLTLTHRENEALLAASMAVVED